MATMTIMKTKTMNIYIENNDNNNKKMAGTQESHTLIEKPSSTIYVRTISILADNKVS